MMNDTWLAGILLLPALMACSSDVQRFQQQAPLILLEEHPLYWTAEEVRELRPYWFDFSERICGVTTGIDYLTVEISGRGRDVMDAIFETMRLYGFAPLPENHVVLSENRYVHPDDIYNCYFMWYGVGTGDMMLVNHWRRTGIDAGPDRAVNPLQVWYQSTFRRLLGAKLSERGLSRFVRIDTTRILDREPDFYEQYMESTGPEHLSEFDANGNHLVSVLSH